MCAEGEERYALVLVCRFIIAIMDAMAAYSAYKVRSARAKYVQNLHVHRPISMQKLVGNIGLREQEGLWARVFGSGKHARRLVARFEADAAKVKIRPYRLYLEEQLHKAAFYVDCHSS